MKIHSNAKIATCYKDRRIIFSKGFISVSRIVAKDCYL